MNENGSPSDTHTTQGPHESLHEALGLGTSEAQCLDLCPICRAADVLRASSSPELREQWQSVQREALVTMKALVEHYLERLDERDREPTGPKVEEIRID